MRRLKMEKISNALTGRGLDAFNIYPSVEKVTLTRGYIYLLVDSSYPNYVKLGMTRDLKRRYKEYNQHKPYNTAEFITVSEVFADAVKVERKILEALVKNIQPIGAKLEWFEVKHREYLEEIIQDAENSFHLYNPAGDINAINRQ